MVIEEEPTPTVTTTSTPITTTKRTTTTPSYPLTTYPITTTTVEEGETTTTTISESTTTTQEPVITPRCGDGYLSWHGTPGGGEEEWDPNTGPYNNWEGAREYPCPSGLECVNCKCVGCGDGRLQEGEECDPNNKMSYVNGQALWEGQTYSCSGEYEYCNSECKCVSSVECGEGLYNSSDCNGECDETCEECVQYQEYPCYKCENKDCSEISSGGVTLYNSYTECREYCDSEEGYCTNWDTCEHCYYCKPYVCGNGVLEPGEQCEEGYSCPDYHNCNSDCQCITDCGAYCGSVGVGYTNYGGVDDSSAVSYTHLTLPTKA